MEGCGLRGQSEFHQSQFSPPSVSKVEGECRAGTCGSQRHSLRPLIAPKGQLVHSTEVKQQQRQDENATGRVLSFST